MEVKIRLTQFDLTSHTRQVLADGPAHFSDNKLTYQELQDPMIRNVVTFGTDTVTIQRLAEISSRTELVLNKIGKAVVSSPYGDMELQTKMTHYFHKEEVWIIEYHVISGQDIVTRQRLIWQMRGVSDE